MELLAVDTRVKDKMGRLRMFPYGTKPMYRGMILVINKGHQFRYHRIMEYPFNYLSQTKDLFNTPT